MTAQATSATSDLGEPHTRDIDLVHLARQTGGDQELEREILALFRDQCAKLSGAILSASTETARRELAHTLRGAAGAVGAFSVARQAERVEASHAGAAADLDRASRQTGARIDRLLA